MMSNAARRSPLHLQISNMLGREIQSGLLVAGQKLTPERKMAADLKISVGTLRKALNDLEDKGMLTRVQGSGNYVSDSVQPETAYALFRLELIKNNNESPPTAQLLDVEKVAKTNSLPSFGDSDSAYRFRRIRMLGDVQAALEEIYLDASYAKSVKKEDVSDSMYLYYKQTLGFWITRVEDKVGVAPPPDWAPAHWHAKLGAGCGYVQRLSRDQKGDVVEYSRTWFDPLTVQFVARS